MSWYGDFWTLLKAAIQTAWPEIGTVQQTVNAEKVNWSNLVEDGTITPPWCVVHIPPVPSSGEWGADNVAMLVTVEVFYIAKDTTADIVTTIAGKLADFQLAICSGALPYTVPTDGQLLDVSNSNPVNVSMLDSGQDYTAGMLRFTCIAGFNLH